MKHAASTLIIEMNRTAAALSCAPVLVCWETPTSASGFCTTEQHSGAYWIGIDPRLPVGRMYQTFLHEAGHAFLNRQGMRLPDQERACWEIASYWAVWIARRAPANIIECITWLRRLCGYHAANPRDGVFQKGANAGRILPGVRTHV